MRDKGNGNGDGSGNGNDRVLRCRDVVKLTGLSRATIYRLMVGEEFPPSHRLSPGRVGWSEAEVEAWIRARMSEPTPPDGADTPRR